MSNPCFELWLLLHLQDCAAHLKDCVDAHRRLEKCLPGYDKTCLAFADFAGGVDDEVERAKRLEPTGRSADRNPSTSVWRLVDEMRGDGRLP